MKATRSLLLTQLLISTAFLAGCENARIVQVGSNTYVASARSAAGAFANTSALKAGVIEDAQKFAAKHGKVVVPLGVTEAQPGVGFPSCEYKFLAVTNDDAKKLALEQARRTAKQQKEWDSLTPAQRIDFTLRMQDLQQREQAASVSELQQRNAQIQGNLDRMSYEQRTRALQQPANVNVNGYINHTVNGRLDVYGH